MGLFEGIFPGLLNAFQIIWMIFSNGGWVVLVLLGIWMLFYLYIEEIQEQYVDKHEQVFISIRVPRENLTSTLAVEQIFSQLHSLHTNFSFGETYMEGAVQLWYALEIVSLGGKINFIIRTPRKMLHTVEAAIYAQYPNAEITEVNDYLESFNYDPKDSDYELWGCEWKLTEPEFIPIKTYRKFEHPTAEVKIVDPLSPLFEALAKVEPHEFMAMQILIWPLADEEWQPKGEILAKKLVDGEDPEDKSWGHLIGEAFHFFNPFRLLLEIGKHEEDNKKNKKEDRPRGWLNLTDIEKERVNLMQEKAGKPGYRTKIRTIYMAPKDKFDKSKRSGLIGGLRVLGSKQTNKWKPDLRYTWTKKDYLISPTLEKWYIDWVVNYRKRQIFKGFKKRSVRYGFYLFVQNIEEIATLFHLPLATTTTNPPVEIVGSKKAQPPVNLPVGEL